MRTTKAKMTNTKVKIKNFRVSPLPRVEKILPSNYAFILLFDILFIDVVNDDLDMEKNNVDSYDPSREMEKEFVCVELSHGLFDCDSPETCTFICVDNSSGIEKPIYLHVYKRADVFKKDDLNSV